MHDSPDDGSNNQTGFVVTPSGTLREWTWWNSKDVLVNKDQPSDPNDPDRQNKISPDAPSPLAPQQPSASLKDPPVVNANDMPAPRYLSVH